ncbi:stretch-activated Ca2+-permeable channel component-domain-containing protein [Blakeslea trispora]|nr:stretch-activated Ca2+-permeable channel component-domain-containing protein [Blakeslea trispora]
MILRCTILLIAVLFQYVHTQSNNTTTIPIKNNQIFSSSISANAYQYFYFTIPSTTQLFRKRDYPPIHLTVSTCSQPQSSSNQETPPLSIYLSTSSTNTLPGPGKGTAVDNGVNGLSSWVSDGASSQLWIAIGGPPLENAAGNWTFEIGASISYPLHAVYQNENRLDNSTIPYFILDDTDRNNALFLSSPFTGSAPNASILITTDFPTKLSYSLCAAKLNAATNYSVNTTATTRGSTNMSKLQFMVSNLSQDTIYNAYMTQTMNGVTGMTTPIRMSTKSDANCRIIYDLPFCSQVAYSVPVNPSTFGTENIWDIANQYDSQALEKFEPFSVALSQFNCETTQYSLVRNCTDCYREYKTWLCSVAIPRCTDASSTADLTQGTDDVVAAPALRDTAVNASRNSWVDETVTPGEWTELLPCIDLCYRVVQSCPPFLKFRCPDGDLRSVQYGYWQEGLGTANGTTYRFDINNPTCNRMGVSPQQLVISAALRITPTMTTIMYISLSLLFIIQNVL